MLVKKYKVKNNYIFKRVIFIKKSKFCQQTCLFCNRDKNDNYCEGIFLKYMNIPLHRLCYEINHENYSSKYFYIPPYNFDFNIKY